MNIFKLMIVVSINLFIVGGLMSCDDPKSTVVIDGPTKMLSDPECSFYPKVEVIATLDKGEKAKVINIRYPKDCMVYKISLADGRVGYITHGDNFRVVEVTNKSVQ